MTERLRQIPPEHEQQVMSQRQRLVFAANRQSRPPLSRSLA
jgi:hypothetical protein